MTTALCCLPTWVWLCAFWLVLGSPGVCTAALQWQFDGVLLPILPSLNRSCCHLYFDLCIPWSIYACEWWEGRRRGGEGAGGKKKERRQQLQYLLLHPRERLRNICLLKAAAQTDAAQKQTTTKPPPPPMSIETACVFCSRRQKTVPFNCTLALWKGLNGAAHRCGNYKKQRQAERRKKKERTKERTAVCYCRFRILHRQQWSQSCGRGLCAQFVRLSSSFGHLWIQQRKAWQRPCEHRYPGTSPPPARRRPTWRSAAWMCLHIPLSSKLSIAKLSGNKQH